MKYEKNIELLVTANNLEEIRCYGGAGADAFLIGDKHFAIKCSDYFNIDEMELAIKMTKEQGKKIYLLVNALYHNDELKELKDYIFSVCKLGIDALVFEDPAVYSIVSELNCGLPLHLSSGSMITNSGVINFWESYGVKRAELARELTVEEIIAIVANTEMKLVVQVYGRTAIFYSRRQLVSSYLEYIDYAPDEEWVASNNDDFLFLREHERPEKIFPLIEDQHGTHLFSDQLVDHRSALADLLSAGIQVFKIDGLFMKEFEMLKIIKDVRQRIDQQLSTSGGQDGE